jgi:hypothetical protein
MLALVLALVLPAGADAAPRGEAHEFRLKGRLEIGPDGRVTDYQPSRDVPALVADIADANVRSWTFEPVLVDGRPVTATTGILLTLQARPTREGGVALEVKDVKFGAHEGPVGRTPPRYPMDAARNGVGAKVIVALRLDADGDVLDVAVEQTSLNKDLPTRARERYEALFEDACIAAVWRWRYGIRERVDGVPVAGTLRVPVEFFVDGARRRYMPGAVRPVPWLETLAAPAAGELVAMAEGDASAMDSVFRLRTGAAEVDP